MQRGADTDGVCWSESNTAVLSVGEERGGRHVLSSKRRGKWSVRKRRRLSRTSEVLSGPFRLQFWSFSVTLSRCFLFGFYNECLLQTVVDPQIGKILGTSASPVVITPQQKVSLYHSSPFKVLRNAVSPADNVFWGEVEVGRVPATLGHFRRDLFLPSLPR
jgi:hypothetical protein